MYFRWYLVTFQKAKEGEAVDTDELKYEKSR